MLNIELNQLKKKDIGESLAKNSWHKLWMKIIHKINSFPNKLHTNENFKHLVLKFKERFEETDCNTNKKGTACNLINKGLNKLGEKYDLKIEVPSLIELAARKVPDEEFERVSRGTVLDPRAAEARKGGKKRKTKKNKKSRKVRKKYKRKTRKGGAAPEPTQIPSLASLAAKNINNQEHLEYANSLLLGDEAAKAEIEKKLLWEKQKADARRATERMRRQMPNFMTSGVSTGSMSNHSVSRPRPTRKVENKPKKTVVKKNPPV